MPNKKEISWQAPEHVYYHKTPRWFVTIAVIGILILTFAIWLKDWLMFFTLLILLVVAAVTARRKPKTVKICLDERGLRLDEILYRYDTTLKSFWIVYQPPEIKTLNFETTNYLNRDITLQLEDQDPLEIRAFLLQYLSEDLEREETYIEKLLRALRF